MKFSKTLSTCLRCIFISVFFLSSTVCVFAQLKKTAKIEKVKSFTAGSVALNKTSLDGVEVYSVTLPNNSKYHQPTVFFLGNKDEMIKNLQIENQQLVQLRDTLLPKLMSGEIDMDNIEV